MKTTNSFNKSYVLDTYESYNNNLLYSPPIKIQYKPIEKTCQHCRGSIYFWQYKIKLYNEYHTHAKCYLDFMQKSNSIVAYKMRKQ
jgi:hypothetical protein